MAQGKQTPRQKMINLMYLVFIAMMALNIDAEIIRSYYESTQSLRDTRQLTETKNTEIFEVTLEAKAAAVPDTYAQPWEQYKVLKSKIDDLVAHVDQVKDKVKKDSEFFEFHPETNQPIDISENFTALNNNTATTQYFFNDGDETVPSNNANVLKQKMDDVRKYITQTFGNNANMKSLVDRANKSLRTEYPKDSKLEDKTWLQSKFYNQPLIAAISNLEIIQNDARNVQSDALALMLQEKVDASIKFNQYDAIVKAPTDVVQGTKAEATVYLASYSNSDKIRISGVNRTENGKGIIGLNTGGLGERKIGGTITVQMANGEPVTIPYTHTYNVIAGQKEVQFETGATISADKMNVLYRNLENPISGSILGVDNSRLSLSAPGAIVKSAGPGKWNVTPTTGTAIKLTVSGTGPRGTQSKTFDFRVKGVPNAQGQIRNQNVVSMPSTSISKQLVTATIPDFDFPVTFTVTGFKFKIAGRAATYITGNSLQSVEGMVKSLRSGDAAWIYDIEATASGLGNQRLTKITPIVINVQ